MDAARGVLPRCLSTRMLRMLWVVVAVAVLMSGCSDDTHDRSEAHQLDDQVVAAIASDAEYSGFGDPYQVELPAVEDREFTTAWLKGEGATAVGLFTQAAQLWASDEPDCIGIAEALDELGTPTEVRTAILSTPDTVTVDLLRSVYFGVTIMLASCDPEKPDLAQISSKHAWQWTIAHRRLVDLGIIL